jgi:DNA-binding transcriptional ArsR family regulator
MSTHLDLTFAALADPTRRGILTALAAGERSVSELAQPFDMSLPGFMKHLYLLEEAGLLTCAKEGRVVKCQISAHAMEEAAAWLARYERFWGVRLDALAAYLKEEEQPSWKKPKTNSTPRSRSAGASRPRRKKSGAR